MLSDKLPARFIAKTAPGENGCIVWTASRFREGYGQFAINARTNRRAHRISYEASFGPIPEGMCVCHKCDNKLCVNPDHLFLGTQKDNIRDCIEKGRAAFRDRHPMRKVTSEQAAEIRLLRQSGMRLKQIGERYGLSESGVCSICKGRSWSGNAIA